MKKELIVTVVCVGLGVAIAFAAPYILQAIEMAGKILYFVFLGPI